MACKEVQFDVVELIQGKYQFECSTCEWNDSVQFDPTIRLLGTCLLTLKRQAI